MDIEVSFTPEKRAQILRGAAEVFAADGYQGASMARIAAVAGVSKGTLYNYFDTKAALFTAMSRMNAPDICRMCSMARIMTATRRPCCAASAGGCCECCCPTSAWRSIGW